MKCAVFLYTAIIITYCCVVRVFSGVSNELINVGSEVATYSAVGTYNHLYGDSVTAPTGSTVCLDTSTPAPVEVIEVFYFNGVELVFELVGGFSDPLVARGFPQVSKDLFAQKVCIIGDPGDTYSGAYRLVRAQEISPEETEATANIRFIESGGAAPDFQESTTTIETAPYRGILGNTLIIAEFGVHDVTITATDIAGDPRGAISWTFRGTGAEETISPNAHYTINSPSAGVSELIINDFVESDLGIYTATATNTAGSDTATANAIIGFAPRFNNPTFNSVVLSSAANPIDSGTSINLDVERQSFSLDAIDLVSFPEGTITWHYFNRQVPNPPLLTLSGEFEVTDASPAGNAGSGSNLRFVNGITDSSQLGYYTAIATNPYGADTSTTLIGVGPIIRKGDGILLGNGDIGNSLGATTGGSLTITTRALKGFPEAVIGWERIVSGTTTPITTGGKYIVSTDEAGDAFLTINGITSSDLGIYRAIATNEFGTDSAVSEVGRGSRIDFNSGDQDVVSGGVYKVGTNLVLNEQTRFSLIANDIDGVPEGSITWDLSGIDSRLYSINRNMITFFSTTDQSIFDTTFSVTASNQYGNDRREFTLRAAPQLDTGSGSVEVTSGTSALLKIGTSVNAQPGTTVRLNAVDIFGVPSGTITWFKGTQQLSVTGNILTISNVDASDYGSYRAVATNQWGSSSATSIINQGNVIPKFPESNLVITGSGNIGDSINAPIGNTITIVAYDIQGIEQSVITWIRTDGGGRTRITDSTPGYSITTTEEDGFTVSTLTTTSANARFGVYTATARNSVGTDVASSTVGLAPVIREVISSVTIPNRGREEVEIGGIVAISEFGIITIRGTDIQGGPFRTFKWYINGVEQKSSGGKIRITPSSRVDTAQTSSTITIINPDSTLLGNYTLVAFNELGSSQASTIIGQRPEITKSSRVDVSTGSGVIGSSFRVTQGGEVIITTCVNSGTPDPTVEFYELIFDAILILTTTQTSTNPPCYETRLTNFDSTCSRTIIAMATNDFGTDSAESRISSPAPSIVRTTISCSRPTGGNIDLQVIGGTICANTGKRLDIECALRDSDIPTTSITWFFQGRLISSSSKYEISNDGSRLSVLNVLNNEDAGNYQCRVENCDGVNSESVNSVVDVYTIRYQCIANQPVCRYLRNDVQQGNLAEIECQREELEIPAGCGTGNQWCIGEWTDCSDSTCHRGRRTRDVFCCEDGNPANRLLEADCDLNSRPPVMERCGPLRRCFRPFSWRSGALSACNAACGPGTQSRTVTCHRDSNGAEVDSSECNAIGKPKEILTCQLIPCQCSGEDVNLALCEMVVDYLQRCDLYYVGLYCCSTCRARNIA